MYYAVARCSSSAHEIINIASSNSCKIVKVTFNKHPTGTAKSLITQKKSQTVVIRNSSFTECLFRIVLFFSSRAAFVYLRQKAIAPAYNQVMNSR